MAAPPDFDVTIFGATGYTGHLVAEHFARNAASGSPVRWALAGRSLARLRETAQSIGAPADTPLVVADATDPASLRAMAGSTRVVVTTAGPYRRYGSELLEACAALGTDYLDLCGESAWMRQMIDAHDAQAKSSGARILFSCGFDSMPSELGVWFCQQVATERLGGVVPRVKGRVRSFVGGASGGSMASHGASLAAAQADPKIALLMEDPFALVPGFSGPAQPPMTAPLDDPDVGPVVPFMLGATDAMNVHRSNFLMGHPYGVDFVYDEMLLGGPDAMPMMTGGLPPVMPKPGEGPSPEMREAGSFDVLLIGLADDGRQVRVAVMGDQDPGYGSTSKMLAETALCLLDADDVPAGVWTPGAALQQRLVDRLRANAGITFVDETTDA